LIISYVKKEDEEEAHLDDNVALMAAADGEAACDRHNVDRPAAAELPALLAQLQQPLPCTPPSNNFEEGKKKKEAEKKRREEEEEEGGTKKKRQAKKNEEEERRKKKKNARRTSRMQEEQAVYCRAGSWCCCQAHGNFFFFFFFFFLTHTTLFFPTTGVAIVVVPYPWSPLAGLGRENGRRPRWLGDGAGVARPGHADPLHFLSTLRWTLQAIARRCRGWPAPLTTTTTTQGCTMHGRARSTPLSVASRTGRCSMAATHNL
jgi:hypothetical protein